MRNDLILYDVPFFLDRKFALKTRLTGSLQVTLEVIKQNCTKFKVLHPALLVVKLAAGSSKCKLSVTLSGISGKGK